MGSGYNPEPIIFKEEYTMFSKSTMTKKITPTISDSIDLGMCGQLFKHNLLGKLYIGGEYYYVTDSHVFGKSEFDVTLNGGRVMSDNADIFAVPKSFSNGEGFPVHFIVTRSSMKKDRTVFFLRLVPKTVSHFGSDMGKVKKLAEMAVADGAEEPYDATINFAADDEDTVEEKMMKNEFVADDLGVLHDANKSFRNMSCHTSRSYIKHFITDDMIAAFTDTACEDMDIVDAAGAKSKVSINDMDIVNTSDVKTTETTSVNNGTQQSANNNKAHQQNTSGSNTTTQTNDNGSQNKNGNNGQGKNKNKNVKPEMPKISIEAATQAANFTNNNSSLQALVLQGLGASKD